MARFHVSADGKARPCKAADGTCPLGGEHFDSLAEAESAFEDTMLAEHGDFATIRKGPKVPALPNGENFDAFLDTLVRGESLWRSDLMESHPAVAAKVFNPYFTVELRRVHWEGQEVFVAWASDGRGLKVEELGECMSLHTDRKSAYAAGYEMVLDWERNWGLV